MTTPDTMQDICEAEWTEFDSYAKRTLRSFWHMGEILVRIKDKSEGSFRKGLESRGFASGTAYRWIKLHKSFTPESLDGFPSMRAAFDSIKPEALTPQYRDQSEPQRIEPGSLGTEASAAQLFMGINPIASPAYHGQQLEEPPVPPPPDLREALERTGIGLATKQPRDDRNRPPSKHHPAPYSEGLFPIFADLISSAALERSQVKLLDPMCGEGSILDISDHLPGVAFQVHASDLYRWTYAREGVHTADATDLAHPDSIFDVICTSPPYANRMADSASGDGDNRVIYADRRESEQLPNDVAAMQWGQQYRLTMSAIWAECVRVAKPGALVIMNCKDHIRLGRIQPVTEFNFLALVRLGCIPTALRFLLTSGVQGVANASARTGFETVVAFTTPTTEQS